MNLYKAALVDLSVDLQPLIVRLRQAGISCRVTEEQGQQCLWVTDQAHIDEVKRLVAEWQSTGFSPHVWGDVVSAANTRQSHVTGPADQLDKALKLLLRYPVTLVTLLLGLLGALIVQFDTTFTLFSWLTIQPIQVRGDQLYLASLEYGLEQGQWWRLITPIFLHFGALHIIFNGLWIWELGRRVESDLGHWALLSLIVVVGVGSNLAQYQASASGLFGGLSGVLYGLVGFLAVWQRYRPMREPLSSGIIIFMIVWLLLCMSGAVDFFIEGSVANTAHIAGLLLGCALAVLALLLTKKAG